MNLRDLPSIDKLLLTTAAQMMIAQYGREAVVEIEMGTNIVEYDLEGIEIFRQSAKSLVSIRNDNLIFNNKIQLMSWL